MARSLLEREENPKAMRVEVSVLTAESRASSVAVEGSEEDDARESLVFN